MQVSSLSLPLQNSPLRQSCRMQANMNVRSRRGRSFDLQSRSPSTSTEHDPLVFDPAYWRPARFERVAARDCDLRRSVPDAEPEVQREFQVSKCRSSKCAPNWTDRVQIDTQPTAAMTAQFRAMPPGQCVTSGVFPVVPIRPGHLPGRFAIRQDRLWSRRPRQHRYG